MEGFKAMSTSPLTVYTAAILAGEIEEDAAQAIIIDALDALHSRLSNHKTPFLHLFQKKDKVEGLYIHGGVGRGKTFLMDMFFDSLPDTVKKKRIHFHEFMRDAHDFLHQKRQDKANNDADALIPALADWISDQCSALCFDEFHVVDIADAMILGRLLDALFARGIILICKSNWPPKDLYKDGLQRARFLPAIDLIDRHMQSVHLDSQNDYRLGRLNDSDLYHYPNDREAQNRVDSLFAKLTDCTAGKAETLIHKNRSITVPCAAQGVARFRFQDLCEQPLGAADYMMLAEKYHTIIIENIPSLGYDRRNETKRLITLIDVLYEQGTMLIITAAREPARLYSGSDHKFEFDRTVSRLLEMQSQDYRNDHQQRREQKINGDTTQGVSDF
jgi:cell division protein ZapE